MNDSVYSSPHTTCTVISKLNIIFFSAPSYNDSSPSVSHLFSCTAFRQISNKIHERNYKDRVFKIPINQIPVANQSFEIDGQPSSGTSLGQLLFMFWKPNLQISLFSPNGEEYSSNPTLGTIISSWTSGVILFNISW